MSVKQLVIFLSFAILVSPVIAQGQKPQRPCDTDAGQQFDFWVGQWDLTWTDAKGNEQKGTNHIRKVLDSCIVEENFDGGGFKGRSYSVYNTKTKEWQQTWVDNQGGYLIFTGNMAEKDMVLMGQERQNPKGQKVVNRMVFKDIQKDSLVWHWQTSADDGKTWKDLWVIN